MSRGRSPNRLKKEMIKVSRCFDRAQNAKTDEEFDERIKVCRLKAESVMKAIDQEIKKIESKCSKKIRSLKEVRSISLRRSDMWEYYFNELEAKK